jgi:tRNA(Ile)-lysidine synthase
MTKVEQQILKFIDENQLIEFGDKILVALSGGPDSVFLLHILLKYQNRFKIELGAIHINHNLRKPNSDKDEEFCVELCKNWDVPFYAVSKNVKKFAENNKLSIEEAAREVRYAEFKKAAKKYSYNKIATAHNLSDNAETVLLNLIKGTGLKGLAGIPIQRDNIIRPALPVSKPEIKNYLIANGILFRIDESNTNTAFERNLIRNEIVPIIKSRLNPSFENTLLNSSEIFRNYVKAFRFEADKYFYHAVEYSDKKLKIRLENIENQYLVNDILNEALIRHLNYNGSFDDFKKITSLKTKKNGKIIELKGDIIAYKENGLIFIQRTQKTTDFTEKTVTLGEKIAVNNKEDMYISLINKNEISYTNNKKEEFISGDKIEGALVVRRWKAGDKFKPLGLNGEKNVSDFLNEERIPLLKRQNQLLLTNKEKIIWVIGLRIDDRYKLTENTKKVLSLCLKQTL